MALFVAGCVEADLVPCGALSCPSGQLCVDGARCVTQQSLDECAERAPGEACSVDNLAGRCADLAGVRLCEPATCGDGVIDEPLREACDGAAAFPTQCVDLGYDLGLPSCTTGCAFDAAPCTRFGWDLVVDAQVSAMWSDGTILAYATRNPDRLEVRGGGIDVVLPMRVDQLLGGAGRVFARTRSQIFEATPAGMVDVTPPTAMLPGVQNIAVGADGLLHALGGCSVARFALSWAQLASVPGNCAAIHVGLGGRVFVQLNSSTVQELRPTGYETAFNADATITAMKFTDGDAYVATTQTLARYDGTRLGVIATGDFRALAIAGDAAYARRADGTAMRWRDGRLDPLSPPGALLGDDGQGHVFAFGGPLYRFSGNAFGDLAPVPMQPGSVVVGSAIADDGVPLAATTHAVWWAGPGGTWLGLSFPVQQIRSLSARGITEYIYGLHSDGAAIVAVGRRHGNLDSATTIDAGEVRGVWLAPDLTAYAVGWTGADGWLGSAPLAGTFAVTRPPNCAFHAIHGAGNRVIAGGTCHGAYSIWELSGGTWSELHRETSVSGAVRAVLLVDDEIFATGDEATLHYAAGAWTVDRTVHGGTLSGVAPDDVWLSGSFVPVRHWDGRAWSKMKTRALGPIAVAADARSVYLPGAAKDHVSLLRDPR